MKVTELVKKAVVKIGLSSAKKAYSSASDDFFYQTREPETVRKMFQK